MGNQTAIAEDKGKNAEDKGKSRHRYNLSHQDAVGVDVARCRRLPTAEKLWRHPEGTPHHLGPPAAVRAAACKAKVRHLGAEYRVDQHVAGLEVCTTILGRIRNGVWTHLVS